MADATLRPAAAADVAAISRLHRAAFVDGWDEAAIAAVLDLLGAFGFVAVDAAKNFHGMALGRVVADEAEILTLAVAAPTRQQGLGGRLVAALAQYAAAAGVTMLHLEVDEGNEAAKRLYTRHGFAIAGRRPRYYRDGTGRVSAALLMRRLISGSSAP